MAPPRLELDHIVVAARTLDEGEAWLSDRLAVPAQPGGRHPMMGTHNRLWRLGTRDYLELIAIDPEAKAPPHPRWFGLDDFTGPPHLVSWVCRSAPLVAPPGSTIRQAARGDLRWRIAIPDSGTSAQDGIAPLLIDWGDGLHPADILPDAGLRLATLTLCHPVLPRPLPGDPRITASAGPAQLTALLQTPRGQVRL